jgi:2-keto-myo-inositol isomerase
VGTVGAPNIAIMLDTWHFFRTAGELEQLKQLPRKTIGGVQIGDAAAATRGVGDKVTGADRLLPGDGVVPLRDIVAIARRNNPAVIVGIEVFNRASTKLPALTRAAAAATAMGASLPEL